MKQRFADYHLHALHRPRIGRAANRSLRSFLGGNYPREFGFRVDGSQMLGMSRVYKDGNELYLLDEHTDGKYTYAERIALNAL